MRKLKNLTRTQRQMLIKAGYIGDLSNVGFVFDAGDSLVFRTKDTNKVIKYDKLSKGIRR